MPLFEPTPYEVLGVARDAGPDAVDAALEEAAGQGRYTPEQLRAAADVLRDPARRLELDVQFLLPPEPVAAAEELLEPHAGRALPFPQPPAWSARELSGLYRRELEGGFAQLPAPPAGLPGVPERFGPDAGVLPPFEPPR